MRVGIVGSAGSGKSTLAQALSAALGAKLIGDTTLDVLKEYHGKTSWRGIKDTRIRRTIRLDALEKKLKAEKEAESFVSDKTAFDYLCYWIQNQAEFETKEQTQSVIDMVKEHTPRYDKVVFLPYREAVDYAEDRSTDPQHNLKVAGLKRGLLTILGANVVDAPYTFGEDMQAWIAKYLRPAPASSGAAPAAPAPAASDGSAEAPAEPAKPRAKRAKKKE